VFKLIDIGDQKVLKRIDTDRGAMGQWECFAVEFLQLNDPVPSCS